MVVGYFNPISKLPPIADNLRTNKGFISFIREIPFLNAVEVFVEADKSEEFIHAVRQKDEVEYCFVNYTLRLSSFQNNVDSQVLSEHVDVNKVAHIGISL